MPPKKNNTKKPSMMARLALERVRQREEEENRIKKEQEEEEKRIQEELEKIKKEQEEREAEKERKRKVKQDKIMELKKSGLYMTKKEKEKRKKNQEKILYLLNNNSFQPKSKIVSETIIENKIDYHLRSPIISILGHVDTGKTKLLDTLKKSNIQKNEVGGITQQMGFSFFSTTSIKKYIQYPNIQIPGFILLDTPGHESFYGIRKRSTNISDIIILVVDILHGIQKQTLECIQLLKSNHTNVIIVLNKIDRLYNWKSIQDDNIQKIIESQEKNTQQEFYTKYSQIVTSLNKESINCDLYWNIQDPEYIPIIPISAKTEEGLSDLLLNLVTISQEVLQDDLLIKENEFESHIVDSDITTGYGKTWNTILIQGKLHIGQEVFIGNQSSKIKHLLTIGDNQDIRDNSIFTTNKSVRGSLGLKIVFEDDLNIKIGSEIKLEPNPIEEFHHQYDEKGVILLASTSNSLEALIRYFKDECNPQVPIMAGNIGKISKKEMISLIKKMENVPEEYRIILCFESKLSQELEDMVKENHIKIFAAYIIYHLYDAFQKNRNEIFNRKKEEFSSIMVYPCILKILSENIFNIKNPIVIGVEILEGNLYIGTPIYVPQRNLYIGKISSMEIDHNQLKIAKKGMKVAIKIETENPSLQFGRHFDATMNLVSKITRESLDVMKTYFKNEITKDDLKLYVQLKKIFNIN
jgi:translation initiation factor 5B